MMLIRISAARTNIRQRHTASIASCSFGLLALLVSAVGCREADISAESNGNGGSTNDSTDITTRVFERDTDKDGKPDYRMETFYRGEKKVMMIISRVNASGVMAVEARSYLVAGNLVLTEGDEDGDGMFESIMAIDPKTKDIEMFVRQADGSVRLASSRVVEAHKKMFGAVAEFFDELSNTNATPASLDDDTIEQRIRATQQKIQDAQREIADDKR
jgi:hypothetical protein